MRYGAIVGLLCASAWILEILVADVWGADLGSLHHLLYYGSILLAALLPGVAGLLAAWRTGRMLSGFQAGLLAGICGGLVLFLAVTGPLSILLSDAGLHDPQSISEFQRSGLPDMQTFLVGDYLAAMIAHLWIGLLTGFVLGAIGGALGGVAGPRSTSP